MTHCLVARRLLYVCLTEPSRARRAGEKITTGGLLPKALKKENGDRLRWPPGDSVDTSAIGRGAAPPSRTFDTSLTDASFGAIRRIMPGHPLFFWLREWNN